MSLHPSRFRRIQALRSQSPPGAADVRNGKPAVLPYTYRPGEAERDAEVEAELAAVRARVAAEQGTP